MINEAAKSSKLSNNAYCCKSLISPSACTEMERFVPRADPRRHERRLTLSLISPYYLLSVSPYLSSVSPYLICLRIMYKVLRSAGGIHRPLRLLRKEKYKYFVKQAEVYD